VGFQNSIITLTLFVRKYWQRNGRREWWSTKHGERGFMLESHNASLKAD